MMAITTRSSISVKAEDFDLASVFFMVFTFLLFVYYVKCHNADQHYYRSGIADYPTGSKAKSIRICRNPHAIFAPDSVASCELRVASGDMTCRRNRHIDEIRMREANGERVF